MGCGRPCGGWPGVYIAVRLALRCLTPGSSGAPTAGHRARAGGTRYMFASGIHFGDRQLRRPSAAERTLGSDNSDGSDGVFALRTGAGLGRCVASTWNNGPESR